MKKLLVFILLLGLAAPTALAQKLIIGEKAPDLRVKEWLSERRPTDGRAQFIEFYHSSSKVSNDRLAILDQIAKKYAEKMDVIVIAKEPSDKVAAIIKPQERNFCVALDDEGRTFKAYAIQYVPFSVVIDSRGRVVRMGNSASPEIETIR